MSSKLVSVEVDLSDFDDDELVAELNVRGRTPDTETAELLSLIHENLKRYGDIDEALLILERMLPALAIRVYPKARKAAA